MGILFPVPQVMIHQLRRILFSIPQNFLFIYLSMPAFENDVGSSTETVTFQVYEILKVDHEFLQFF